MKKLRLSPEISLPLDVVTQSIGILAKRRVGKSYTARTIVEELFDAGQQVCIVDPKGDWWGVRSASDGRNPGMSIFILGGEHGEVPLEVSGGPVVAKLLVEERVSVLLDLSLFRKHEVATFMTSFLEDLYRLKAQEKYRTPLMLMVDEADAIAPQKPQDNEARMLGAIEDIVRRGGQRGIGCTMVTQRSAVLNKNVLTQIQMLICLRTIAPQDLKAMDEWIQVHGEADQRKVLMASLPSLPVGDAWFWSPGWPTETGIFTRTHIRPIRTFDSGATPKPGEKRITPRNLANVDIDILRRQMEESVVKAKENDPAELKKRIKELELQLKKVPVEKVKEKIKEVPVIKDGQIQRLEVLADKMINGFMKYGEDLGVLMGKIQSEMKVIRELKPTINIPSVSPVKQVLIQKGLAHKPSMLDHGAYPGPGDKEFNKKLLKNHDSSLGKAERAILTVLAQYLQGRTKVQIAVIAGYSHKGGSFNNAIYKANANGWITRAGDTIGITKQGLEVLGDYTPLPTGDALLQHWYGQLGKAERAILEFLAHNHPGARNKDQIAVGTGYEPGGGSFNNAIYRLRSLELIEGKAELRASDNLFG